MSSRHIRCASGLLLAALVSCSGGGGGGEALPEEGASLKISYFRAYPEPRTKKLEPTYKAVMTNTWRERMGESPRDPLVKAAPGKLYVGFLSDAELWRYLQVLKGFGLDKLRPRDTDALPADDLRRASMDPKESEFTRVITVGTDQGSKSYYYRDQQSTPELIEAFRQCEKFVVRISEYSIQVRVSTPDRAFPTAPK